MQQCNRTHKAGWFYDGGQGTASNTLSASFTYDAFGRRIQSSITQGSNPAQTVQYLYEGQQALGEIRSGQLSHRLLSGLSLNETIARIAINTSNGSPDTAASRQYLPIPRIRPNTGLRRLAGSGVEHSRRRLIGVQHLSAKYNLIGIGSEAGAGRPARGARLPGTHDRRLAPGLRPESQNEHQAPKRLVLMRPNQPQVLDAVGLFDLSSASAR